MTDADILTLCCFAEANLEPDEGVAAVAKVVLNRTRLRYASDGTIQGTILHPGQFSWVNFSMVGGHYIQVAVGLAAELARTQYLLGQDEKYATAWARCGRIAAEVQQGSFSGPLFSKLTAKTVLYDNLALAKPYWAATSKQIAVIGHHTFFEPVPAPAEPLALAA